MSLTLEAGHSWTFGFVAGLVYTDMVDENARRVSAGKGEVEQMKFGVVELNDARVSIFCTLRKESI